jgi:tRNA A37 threonylcarbamoyladenosine modification protein TsaB
MSFKAEYKLLGEIKKIINRIMINDFLVINCTGKNDSIGLKINSNFFVQKLQTNIRNNELLVNNIIDFIKKKNVKIDDKFSVLVNLGPGSFTSIRVSLAVAKGINITKKASLYGYKDSDLTELNLKNIDLLIKKHLIENKLIKPVYIS